MGDSDHDGEYWREQADVYGGFFTSEDFQADHWFESASHSINDEESGSKKIRLSPEFGQQEEDIESCAQSSPLGLTLSKTPSFLSLLQMSLSKGNQPHSSRNNKQMIPHHDRPRTNMDDSGSEPTTEKLKASNFPATFIKIGAWQRVTRHEGDLIAKLYYAKRKMVWEVLDGALKTKIEIQWSDIIAIRAITPDNEPGILQVELNQPPLFYRETNPQPRKHTLWQQASDFTGGQAPIWRRHYVKFPPGILDKHYEKLLQCDQRLFALSQKPFPSHDSPYFNPTMFGISEYASGYLPRTPYSYHTYPPRSRGAHPRLSANSTASGVDWPFRNGGGSNKQQPERWGQLGNVFSEGPSYITSPTPAGHQVFNYQPNVGLLNDIENHLLGESQVVSSLLESTDANANYNADHISGNQYHIGDGTTGQVLQINGTNTNPVLDGFYSETVGGWLPHQDSNDSRVMEEMVNNSLPPFPGNSTNGDFRF